MSSYYNIFMDIPSTKLVDNECEYTKPSWEASWPIACPCVQISAS